MAGEKILSFICCVILWHTARGSNISGLYFQLNGKQYLPGEAINVLEIGQQPTNRSDPGSTLICITTNVNAACCRGSDGGRLGNWYYPNGTEVPRPSHYHSHNYRIGYTHQVRLTRKKDVLGPLGRYTCSIPDPQGRIWSASIFLVGSNFSGLYFQLNGKRIQPGESVNPLDIGPQSFRDRSDPGFTLICMTENINPECCRSRDGANVGNWYYPDRTKVPRTHENNNSPYNRVGDFNQVRLASSKKNGFGPFGRYTCSVPDLQGHVWSASIFIKAEVTTSLTSTKNIVMTGESVSFNCSTHSRPYNGTVSRFTMPNGTVVNLVNNSPQGNEIVYTISPVKLSHAGQYSCSIIGGKTVVRGLYVEMQPPVSVLLLSLIQPIYATSSPNITYHIQLLHTMDVPSHFNIKWTPPMNSYQILQERNISALGKSHYEGVISLTNVRMEDRGRYISQAQMTSPNQYIIASNFTMGSVKITIKDIPSINATVTPKNKPVLGNLYLLICSSTTFEANFIYTSAFQWYHNGVRLNGRSSRVLRLPSLALSDVGNYTCRVTATSRILGQPIVADSPPHTVILRAPSPVAVQLAGTPTSVFHGTSLLLTCTIVFSPTVNVYLTVNTKLNGPSIALTRDARIVSTSRYEAAFTIPSITGNHTGNYSCSSIASGISISPSSLHTSNTVPINPVGPPSTPTLHESGQGDTNVRITWSVPEKDTVQYFQIYYSYQIRGCTGLNGENNITVDNHTRSYYLTNLEENSDIFITLSSFNQAGQSIPATIKTYTLPAAPTKPPANVMPVALTSTSISFAWDPIPCSYRNTNVTGYSVTYRMRDICCNVAISLGTTDVEYLKVNGLIPGTTYIFVIIPIHNFNESPQHNGLLELKTARSNSLGLFLNGRQLPNNSIVEPSVIGLNENALFCITNLANCCRRTNTNFARGFWIFPNQTNIPSKSYLNTTLSRSRSSSSVILHRNSNHEYTDSSGLYNCKIPDSEEKYQNLYVFITDHSSDIYILEVDFNRKFMYLTCASTGRPVDSWEWLRDGTVIDNNDSNFNQTQAITNYTTPTYVQYLFSEDMANIIGRFTCVVRDSEGNTDRKTTMINNCPPGKYGAVAFDGSTVCVPCPANSMSTSVGSNGCGCLLGYYRNHLEDNHFPCSRSPSNCRALRVKEESYGSAVLEWSRPYIPGRPDLYYDVYISNSELSGKYVKFNSYPIASDSARMEYTVTGLQPLSMYQVKVSVSNGVSASYEEGMGGVCETSWTTSNSTVDPPESLSAVCGMVAWQAPSTAQCGLMTGYEVHISLHGKNKTFLVSKKHNQFYHHFFQDGSFLYNSNQNFTAFIKVRGKVSAAVGAWSKTIDMRCPQ